MHKCCISLTLVYGYKSTSCLLDYIEKQGLGLNVEAREYQHGPTPGLGGSKGTMCLVKEVQGSCWRGARGVICEAVGNNGRVSVVVRSRGTGML